MVLWTLTLFSCKKDSPTEQPTDLSGRNLTIKVLDENNQAIKSAKLYVTHIASNSQITIIDDSIIGGTYDVGKLIQGDYGIEIYAPKGKKIFREEKAVQIVEGANRTIEIFPYSNSGNLKIKATNQSGNKLVGINAALIPHGRYEDAPFSQLYNEALEIMVTNNEGEVVFTDLPASYSQGYSIMIFRNEFEYDYPENQQSSGVVNVLYIPRGTTKEAIIKTNL